MLEVGKYYKTWIHLTEIKLASHLYGLQSLFFSPREQEASSVPSQAEVHWMLWEVSALVSLPPVPAVNYPCN